MGGALAVEPPGGTAFPNRDAVWMLTVAAIWTDAGEPTAPLVAWARGLWQEMRPWSTGTYVNHLGDEGAERVRGAYGTSRSFIRRHVTHTHCGPPKCLDFTRPGPKSQLRPSKDAAAPG